MNPRGAPGPDASLRVPRLAFGRSRRHARRLALSLLASTGCIPMHAPMPPPTLVALGPRDTGALDMTLSAGTSSNTYVNGIVQFEPYVTPKTSITIGGAAASDFTETHAIGRVGARHRFGEHFALGGGIGPAYTHHTGEPPALASGEVPVDWWAPYLDLEIIAGYAKTKKRFSGMLRPGVTIYGDRVGLALPLGLSFAKRLGPFVSVGFDTWAGARFLFTRPDVSPGPQFSPNPLIAPEFGGSFSISFHAPPPKKPKPRVLFDL